LPYTADGLSGSARDMARVRGVGPADRSALIDAIAAVLERDPTAVASARSALISRREVATESLAFELAGRLWAEGEALDWVVAPQRATGSGGDDLDGYGWADGVLLRLEVRGGRLCGWSGRACSAAAARARVAATPPDWAEFAR